MICNNMLNYHYYSNILICIVIIPKIGVTLKIVCSKFVAQDVLKLQERCAKITNRVILALSINDIIFSITFTIFGIWLVPQELVHESTRNQGTCKSQGFLTMFSTACGDFINMTLTPTYILQVQSECIE